MSADLFAEFNDLSSDSAPAPKSTPDQPSNLPTAPAQTPGWSGDLLSLGHARSSSQSNPQPLSNWGVSRPQPWTAFSQPAQPSDPAAADDDDGWGDFEVADSAPLPIVSEPRLQKSAPSHQVSGATTANPGSHMFRTEHRQPPAPSKSSIPSWPQPQKRPGTQLQAEPGDPSVLFDADDFELSGGDVEDDEGDEFGDFATAAPPSPRLQTVGASTLDLAPSIDLIGLEDGPQQPSRKRTGSLGKGVLGFGASPSSHTRPSKPASALNRDLFSDLSDKVLEKSSSDASSQPAIAWTSRAAIGGVQTTKDEDDEWGAWDDDTLSRPVAGGPQPPDNWDWDVVDSSKPSTTEGSNDSPPPINVPPPSVILSAFPDILNSGTSLLKPLAAQNNSVKERVLSDPKALQFLQGYALLGTTAAKVIAGRKLRWHRDKMLTKSMSISTAGSKGMKLAGVDKTQSAREDRESADVVAAWREHVGRLRAAIATANASGKANLRVPELSENMQIQTATMVPTARGPCLICGLKREERVARVDLDVEDSFGEWWVEYWGHRACKNFWLEHEQRLRQR